MALTDTGASASKVIGQGPFIFVTAGGAWRKGDPIAVNGSQAFVRADDNGGLIAEFIAATDAASGQQRCKLYESAVVEGQRFSGGVAGTQVFVSDTAGRYAESAGTNSRPIGRTIDADSIFCAPRAYLSLTSGFTITAGASEIADDLSLNFGTDADVAIRLKSTSTLANTAVAGVLAGTPVSQALAANSGIISNVTQDGDLGLYVSGLGGANSLEALWVDASAGLIKLGHGGFDVLVANGQGLTIGADTQLTVGGTIPEFQVQGTTTGVDGSMALVTASETDSSQSSIKIVKSGNAALGSFTTVAQSEALGAISWHGDDGVDYATVAARIRAIVNTAGTVAASRVPADLIFDVDPGGGDDAIAEKMRLSASGPVIIGNGTTVSHAGALGPSLVIDQLGNDDAALVLASSDVGTGLGSIVAGTAATTDYMQVQKFAAATGGVRLMALGENAAVTSNLVIESIGGQAHTTHTTGGRALVEVYASQHDGANALADLSDGANAFAVRLRTGTADATKMIVDENGEIYNDGTVTAYDEEDDVALVRAFDVARSDRGIIQNRWDSYVTANAETLSALGILGRDEDGSGGRPLVNVTRLQKLHNGAIWQLASDLMDVVAALPKSAQDKLPERFQNRLALAGAL